MLTLSLEALLAEREEHYRRRPELRLQSEEEAARFVDEVGVCVLFPVQRIELPSLWEAINGCTRPLPRHHDDEALSKTWHWKDSLPAQGRIYYGKLLRGKKHARGSGPFAQLLYGRCLPRPLAQLRWGGGLPSGI